MMKEPLQIHFPADADFVPAVRKFIAEASLIEGFSQKFSYRTEIIVDELCNNAVKYGPSRSDERIRIQCCFDDETLQLTVQDSGGDPADVRNLKEAIDRPQEQTFLGKGLEIVRMLTSNMELTQTPDGETVVRVTKKRSQNLIDSLAE